MRNVILFDDDSWEHLLPLTYTRPTSEIRCGILTVKEKWQLHLDARVSYITQEYLADAFPIHIEDDNWVISGNLLPNPKLIRVINDLSLNEALMYEDELVAARLSRSQFDHLIHNEQIDELIGYTIDETPINRITKPWHIFQSVGQEIENDFHLLTKGRPSIKLDETNSLLGSDIFIEAGAEVKHCIMDSTSGPIYIGKDAKLLPGSMIMGPFALGEKSVIKMGAKIYGPTSIGPGCTVGGEIKNSVLFGNSNKGHDGYLGNSVVGEWCNIGADTNTSNLRNDYAEVALWSHQSGSFEKIGSQFCGVIMADHSKCGINTMLNTGTVVGVSCNIFGGGFPPQFIPSFSWGGSEGLTAYRLEKAIEVAERVMTRKNRSMDQKNISIFNEIHNLSADQR